MYSNISVIWNLHGTSQFRHGVLNLRTTEGTQYAMYPWHISLARKFRDLNFSLFKQIYKCVYNSVKNDGPSPPPPAPVFFFQSFYQCLQIAIGKRETYVNIPVPRTEFGYLECVKVRIDLTLHCSYLLNS